MKNFILLLLFFAFSINYSFSQTRAIMGGGIISPNFENSIPKGYEYFFEPAIQPFVGFTYEHNLNKPFSVTANLNYSRNKILDISILNSPIDFFVPPKIKFAHVSISGLLNYKIFSRLTNSNILNGFKIGLGLNIDSFRDFRRSISGFTNQDLTHKENNYQVGLLSNISWEYKKFKLNYNFMNSMEMFGNDENLIQSTDWKTLSASYIYTLSD